ncbi:small subunit ribosomal protein S29e [Nematocida homosporus]|uniref:small subunit ribosomal protein S29e n=1 Tax=Nematocida homosporus TaxID=1912981 RepID=UPI00221EFC7F|nr:small subunit ribosomal protein S29e [Nematocida homosporus]KAI5187980.1 small subunit ribosomal protein S29e [Nematocida homosporus]
MESRVIKDIMSLPIAEKSSEPKGKGSRECRSCSNHRGLIRTYNLYMCRRCFREYALDIGFKKVN